MIRFIKRPKSKRYFQLRFEGFESGGRSKFGKTCRTTFLFLKAFFLYFAKKVRFLGGLGGKILVWMKDASFGFRGYLIRKLIWSRGRLGRPVVNFVVMGIAFTVFMFGGVFNSSPFVTSQEISPDYLSNVTDIIPQKQVATTLVPESRKRAELFVYVVAEGDTLSSIGEKFKISVDALEYVNDLSDYSILKIGQEITVPPVTGLIHAVEKGDTLASIAEKYEVPMQAIADFNYILDTSSLAVGAELVIPDAKVPGAVIPVTPTFYARGPAVDVGASKGWCLWPTTVNIISQYFAWYHSGIDIATPWGSMPPIFACSGGVVTRAGWNPWGLGLVVQVDHGNGYSTVYGHLNRINVSYGQEVSKGQVIGMMGNTGRSTGPHLHFEIRYNGAAQNPFNYF